MNQHPTGGKGIITSGFYRSSGAYHGAIDVGVPSGTPIYSVDAGEVIAVNAACEPNGGFIGNTCGNHGGNWVKIKHSETWGTEYMHLSTVNVKAGQFVKRGQVIGLSGNSGNSSGPHLHFVMRVNGIAQDGAPYLKNQKPWPETTYVYRRKIWLGLVLILALIIWWLYNYQRAKFNEIIELIKKQGGRLLPKT